MAFFSSITMAAPQKRTPDENAVTFTVTVESCSYQMVGLILLVCLLRKHVASTANVRQC